MKRFFFYSQIKYKKYATLYGLAWAILFSLPTGEVFGASGSNGAFSCIVQSLQRLLGGSKPNSMNHLEELLDAFSHGLLPDLSDASQRNAFEFYRRMRFGDPNTELNSNTVEVINEVLKKYPKIEKEPFRNYSIKVMERIYPTTQELSHFLDVQLTSAGQVRSNLFQIDANSGYWKKVFQYDESDLLSQLKEIEKFSNDRSLAEKGSYRLKSRELKVRMKNRWMAFLDSKIAPELRSHVSNPQYTAKDRSILLFRLLLEERNRMVGIASKKAENSLDLRPISQAMIDLVHTIGYHDSLTLNALKGKNGMERLIAYRKILADRDRFALELGFKGKFDEMMEKLAQPVGVYVPNGVPIVKGMNETLRRLEQGVVAGVQVDQSDERVLSKYIVRHLSLIESPFRSCLGGSDCSSRSYLSRALDPNYHYFTLTDPSGTSSGQVTVVLGTGSRKGESIRVGFLDKIQNIPNSDLPRMLEAIRRSLGEKGYLLIIPDDVGDHIGISNEEMTRLFVSKKIVRDLDHPVLNFKPHPHQYQFPADLSRAELRLPSHAYAPLEAESHVEIASGELTLPWKVDRSSKGIDLNQLLARSVNLKNSDFIEDRLRYISSMKLAKSAGLKIDPDFEEILNRWIEDEQQSFTLRKKIFIDQWLNGQKTLLTLMNSFSFSDQLKLIQSLLASPRYREKIQNDQSSLPRLLVNLRSKQKIKDLLLDSYLNKQGEGKAILSKLLESKDLPELLMVDLIQEVKSAFTSISPEKVERISESLKDTENERFLISELVAMSLSSVENEIQLGRMLTAYLSSVHGRVRNFGYQMVMKGLSSELEHFKLIRAFGEIAELQYQGKKPRAFDEAASSWIQSPEVSSELKAHFLLSQFGIRSSESESAYEKYQRMIPKKQKDEVFRQMDHVTPLRLFEKLAESQPNAIEWFRNADFEDFDFKTIRISDPVEIQSSPVTQLQWLLVMGENSVAVRALAPFEFQQPVKSASAKEISEFLERINAMDSNYQYRLPTQSELEYAQQLMNSKSKTSDPSLGFRLVRVLKRS